MRREVHSINQGRCSFKERKGTKLGISNRGNLGCGPSLFLSLYLDWKRKHNNRSPGKGTWLSKPRRNEMDGSDAPDFRLPEPVLQLICPKVFQSRCQKGRKKVSTRVGPWTFSDTLQQIQLSIDFKRPPRNILCQPLNMPPVLQAICHVIGVHLHWLHCYYINKH